MTKLVYLGTGGSTPLPNRGLSCTVLALEKGGYIMVDCGDGTIQKYLKSDLKWNKTLTILFTHLHLDHTLGIFSLLSTMDLQGRDTGVHIYGPIGTKKFLRNLNGLVHKLNFRVYIHEIKAGVSISHYGYNIETYPTKHRIESIAYRIQLPDTEGHLDVEKCKKLGIKEGKDFGILKSGEDITFNNGNGAITVCSKDVVGTPTKGKSFGFSGDTRVFPKLGKFFKDVDYLTFESTFTAEEIEHAIQKKHSTASEAGKLAKDCGAKTLILNHFGARHEDPREYEEASLFHDDVRYFKDLDVIEV